MILHDNSSIIVEKVETNAEMGLTVLGTLYGEAGSSIEV